MAKGFMTDGRVLYLRNKIAVLIRLFKLDEGSLDRALSHLKIIRKVSARGMTLKDTNFAVDSFK